MNKQSLLLAGVLARKDVRTRYLDSLSGLAWVIIQPLLLLLIYSFVFVVIFKARVPEADLTGFVPYLAIAFWPWTAFSEAVLRSIDSITENSELIGKIRLESEVFPLATVTSTFLLNLLGYAAVLLVLQLTGTPIHWLFLPVAIVILLLVYCFAIGLALILSSLSVFVRDLRHALPALMMLWFFSTPIIYSITLIPERYRHWFDLNPFYYHVLSLREMLLFGNWRPGLEDAVAVGLTLAFLWFSFWFFRRLSPRFEDFL